MSSRGQFEPERAAGRYTRIHTDRPALRADGELAEGETHPDRVVAPVVSSLEGPELLAMISTKVREAGSGTP